MREVTIITLQDRKNILLTHQYIPADKVIIDPILEYKYIWTNTAANNINNSN